MTPNKTPSEDDDFICAEWSQPTDEGPEVTFNPVTGEILSMENKTPSEGMTAEEKSKNPIWPIGEFAASEWVDAFNYFEKQRGAAGYEPDVLVGWFANAIMTGYDIGAAKGKNEGFTLAKRRAAEISRGWCICTKEHGKGCLTVEIEQMGGVGDEHQGEEGK